MFKYQYLIREYLFRLLLKFPAIFRKLIVFFMVGKNRQFLSSLETPAQLILYVTNRCNARCSHCFYWKEVAEGVKKELSLTQIERIAYSLKNPLSTLSLTGGEPFLRDDLFEICKCFIDINKTKKINIVTNGFLSEKIIAFVEKILSECPIDLNVQISLDGLKETHDAIRKIAVFEKALATASGLQSLSRKYRNFQVTFQTTIIKQNLNELVDLGNFLQKQFPSVHHGFQFVRSPKFDVYQADKEILSDLDLQTKNPLLSVEEMKTTLRAIRQFSNKQNLLLSSYVDVMNQNIIRMKEEKIPFVKCLAGKYDAVVWPDGVVSMCEFTKPFASLIDYDFNFYNLWKSRKADEMRQRIMNCFCTHTCNLLNAMQFDEETLNFVFKEASQMQKTDGNIR